VKKILVIFLFVFLLGCFGEAAEMPYEKFKRQDENIQDDVVVERALEKPRLDGYEYSYVKSSPQYVSAYYTTDKLAGEIFADFGDWALENGWKYSEESTADVKKYSHSDYVNLLEISFYEIFEDGQEITKVCVKLPRRG